MPTATPATRRPKTTPALRDDAARVKAMGDYLYAEKVFLDLADIVGDMADDPDFEREFTQANDAMLKAGEVLAPLLSDFVYSYRGVAFAQNYAGRTVGGCLSGHSRLYYHHE